MKDPIRVLVTGAAGQISYTLLYIISKGDVFGRDQPLHLHLFDIEPMIGNLKGVEMELRDCSLPLIETILATADEKAAFSNIDAAFLIGAMPRKEGMKRKDLLKINVKIFKTQGRALDSYAKKSVKVLVVANPANTNALVCSKYAPSIPKENFAAMTRLDQNRATSLIASRLNVGCDEVSNVIIWGNHSLTLYPDVSHAVVNINGVSTPVPNAINDKNYFETDFITTVQKRGEAVIAARKLSSAMSASKAASDHMRDWFHGTAKDRYISMAVYSGGSYGVPSDVMFSFPVTIGADKKWKIVEGLSMDDFSKTMLAKTGKELLEEKEEAFSFCKD